MVFCPVVAVMMLESVVERWLAPDSPAPQQIQPGKKTIGSETQSDLLIMGVKTPETC